MRKRSGNATDEEEPPVKRSSVSSTLDIKNGEILTDITGKEWRIGKAVGLGAFGEIFLASDNVDKEVDDSAKYVVKIESHTNGPLFVEINCYLRIAKPETIEEWKINQDLASLGMPHYIASGSHCLKDTKCRFLILPRYYTDLEHMLQKKKRKLHLKTVLTITLQLLDVLQYIHSKGFIHADIKASNILLNFKKRADTVNVQEKHYFRYVGNMTKVRTCRLAKIPVIDRNLRTNNTLHTLDEFTGVRSAVYKSEINHDQMYLLDYGLASKYVLSNGEHKCADLRRAHAGTILFCSLDAHRGALSRRSDLESLGYNIVYWLTSYLPWFKSTDDADVVRRKKQQCMSHLEPFLNLCFGQYPKFLIDYFKYLNKLDFSDKPDYNFCRKLFKNALFDYGYEADGNFDFNKVEPWQKKSSENSKVKKIEYVIRTPLKSNLPIKPVLRKKNKNKKINALNWSKILMDPEEILKQGKTKERKLTESSNDGSQSLSNLNIKTLNPTEAMIDVYNNYVDKMKTSDGSSPKYKSDCNFNNIEGYTTAMMLVYNRMMEQREIEKVVKTNSRKKSNKNASKPSALRSTSRVRTRRQKVLSENPIPEKYETRRTKPSVRIYSLRG